MLAKTKEFWSFTLSFDNENIETTSYRTYLEQKMVPTCRVSWRRKLRVEILPKPLWDIIRVFFMVEVTYILEFVLRSQIFLSNNLIF